MTKRRLPFFPTTNGLLKEAVRGGAALLLGLALTVISPPPVSGSGGLAILGQRSQQEEQQRQQQEQQQRELQREQQREQQQRQQQARQAHVVNDSGGATSSTTKELATNPSRSAAASNAKHSESAKTELRRRTCENGPCKETPAAPTKPDVRQGVVQCQPNEIWNGAACVPASPAQCKAGEFWDGLCCVNTAQKCASFNTRGAMQQNEIRGIRTELEQACRNNPSGQKCVELRQSYDGAILRYRMLMNEAPVACRSLLLDPLAI